MCLFFPEMAKQNPNRSKFCVYVYVYEYNLFVCHKKTDDDEDKNNNM